MKNEHGEHTEMNGNFIKGCRYCATDFKDRWHADFGAASTHGGNHCTDCRHCRAGRYCRHPVLHASFSLGTHPERMGCRNCFEGRGK